MSVTSSADGQSVILAVLAKSTGNCWYIVDNTAAEGSGVATANLTVPWSSSTTWSTATSVPTTAGTYYGEWKNVSGTVPTCSASVAPTGTSGTNYLFQATGGFPSM